MRALPDHALLDRIIRGRAWIPLLGIMLAGIVAMQVEVLKLEAGVGRSMQRTSELATRNDTLRASVAKLADDRRIMTAAARMGMIMPAPEAIDFLQARAGGNPEQAIANIHSPDPGGFLSALSAQAAGGSSDSQSGSTDSSAKSGAPTDTGSPQNTSTDSSTTSTDASSNTSTDASSPSNTSTDASSPQTTSTPTHGSTTGSTQTTNATGG